MSLVWQDVEFTKEKPTNHRPIVNNGLIVGTYHKYVFSGRLGDALTLFRLYFGPGFC